MSFKPKVGKKASDALRESLQPPADTIKPTPVVAKEMFAAAAAAPKKVAAAAAAAAAAAPKKVVAAAAEAPAAAPKKVVAASLPPPPPPPPEAEDGTELIKMLESQDVPGHLSQENKDIAGLILAEEKKDPYNTSVPTAYVPQTRRGFAEFIKLQYAPYILPEGPIQSGEGEKYYPYQKFVRDYMRKEAPYRGILVYHGLGSGKTCTAIAAAEALFATAKKNIIVMSPKSLKKNFLREVSKCGFRHFQLKNFWKPLIDHKTDPTAMFFANTVLGLSPQYLKRARRIWVPDFRKKPEESNYDSLEAADRDEIRRQIMSIVEYDEKTNPTGRIRFISYNGVTAKRLMAWACDPAQKKFFDDAVIIVDEIHNLIRIMEGTIEPYLTNKNPGKERSLPIEYITPERWVPNPSMCDPSKTSDFYSRGYLFYRLLLDARNSKIVGLSGTPLINYPHELGILANVLHGYITIVEGSIGQSGQGVEDLVMKTGHAHPFVDYVGVNRESGETRIVLSILPEGNIKIKDDVGIKRIPPFIESSTYTAIYAAIADLFKGDKKPAVEEIIGAVRGEYKDVEFPTFETLEKSIREVFTRNLEPSRKELSDAIVAAYNSARGMPAILASINAAFAAAGIPFQGGAKARSEALLPPYSEEFRDKFIEKEVNLINKAALVTRLTGIVSYYKGSSLELMPRVKTDEVVRVPFSIYAQKAYSLKRGVELKKELTADKTQSVDKVLAQIYKLADTGSTSNYKMGSRQTCNFVFPPEVARPDRTEAEEKDEAEQGVVENELVTLAEDAGEPAVKAEVELAEEKDDAAAAPAAVRQQPESKKAIVTTGDETDALIREYYESRGEEVPPEYRGLGAENDKIKAAEMDRMQAAWKPEDAEEREQLMRVGWKPPKKALASSQDTLEGGGKTLAELRAEVMAARAVAAAAEKEGVAPTAEEVSKAAAAAAAAAVPAVAAVKPVNKTRKLHRAVAAVEAARAEEGHAAAAAAAAAPKPVNTTKKKVHIKPALAAAAAARAAEPPEPSLYEFAPQAPRATPKRATAAPKEVSDAQFAANCKAGRQPGQSYSDACDAAKKCLETVARARMLLEGEEGLANYSAKFAAMLERIRDAPGSSLVYSQFLSMEGVGIFRVAMNVNGYAPIEMVATGAGLSFTKATEESLRLGPGKQPRYITFSGVEDEAVRAAALSIFNAQFSELPESMNALLKEAGYTDNKVGELCRVFCITSAGAEGLSLRNVRAVHIMEPYWNEVRLKQVKGRAIRIGSHLDLPVDQRNVSIYTYLSVFSDEAQSNKVAENRIDQTILLHDSMDSKKAQENGIKVPPGLTNYVVTTDEMIYIISERKRKIIDAIECILKSSSVDCEINLNKNKDTSFMCLPLKGKIGDFLYRPVLDDDIKNAPQFDGPDGKDLFPTICTTGVDPARDDTFRRLKGVWYRLRPVYNEAKDVTQFDMYSADQQTPAKKIPEVKVGTAGVGVGKAGEPVPGPPIKLL